MENTPEAAGSVIGHNSQENAIAMLSPASDIKAMVKKDVESLRAQAKEIIDVLGRVPASIDDEDVYQRVIGLAANIREFSASREKMKKAHKDPYNKAATAIENEFKLIDEADEKMQLVKEVEKGLDRLTRLVSEYDTKKFLEDEARAEKERAAITEALKKDGIELEEQEVGAVKLATSKSEHGGMGVKKVETKWEVVNENDIPRSLLSVDPAKVQALIDQGAKEIPGIKLTKVVNTTIRR